MPAQFDNLFYPSADGRLTLYARIYPGNEPTLLLMHGLTRNSADFEELAGHLAGRHRLVVPDQRGRGRSQYDNEPANYVPATYCADMFALINRLELDHPVLVGTSMGGFMAMIMGSTQPEQFRALIINDIGPIVEQAGLDRIGSYVGMNRTVHNWSDAAAYCRTVNGAAFPAFGEVEWMHVARRLFTEDKVGSLRLAYDPAIAAGVASTKPSAVPPDLWPMWDALAPLPILAIRGALSDVLGARTLEQMRRRHHGMQAVTVPGVGHAPMLDEPEALSAIGTFLAKLGVQKASPQWKP
jgi:pimeloyl-ACP methyl ester carboxylesterase